MLLVMVDLEDLLPAFRFCRNHGINLTAMG